MTIESIDPLAWLRKAIEDGCPDMVRPMVREFAQVLMEAEVDELCGAPRGARDP